jgi:DNA-binding Lrp family transcriptional regulator
MFLAYSLIVAEPGECRSVCDALRAMPHVVAVEETSGPYDAIVKLEAPSVTALQAAVMQHLRCLPGVRSATTLVEAWE